MSLNSRAVSLKEELASKAAALSDTQQQLKHSEQAAATLKVNMEKLTEEHAKLDKKAQSLAGDLQKVQQEKEVQKKELSSTQESLGKAKKAVKESQSLLDTERKNHKAALEEKVMIWKLKSFFLLFLFSLFESALLTSIFIPQEKCNEKTKQELLKNNEAITKTMNDYKGQSGQLKEVGTLSENNGDSVKSLLFNAVVLKGSVLKLQAEKKLEMQLSAVKQQHSKTQEAVKEKEGQLEKLQAQLKTTQGSFEEELKRLQGQITTLEQSNAKKARGSFKCKQTHLIADPWLKTA